jgi:Hint module
MTRSTCRKLATALIVASTALLTSADLSNDAGATLDAAVTRLFNPSTAGNVIFYKAANFTAPICPSYKIVHEEIKSYTRIPATYVIPHTKIVQDGVRCGSLGNGEEYLWVVPSLMLMDERSATAAGVIEVYKALKANTRASGAFSSLVNVDPIFVGAEVFNNRICGDKTLYPKGSVFFFIQAEGKHLDLGALAWIYDKESAMLGYQPPVAQGSQSLLCVYKTTVNPGPGVSPLPSPPAIATPAASSSPNAFAAIAGQDVNAPAVTTAVPDSTTAVSASDTTTVASDSLTSAVASTTAKTSSAACFPASATVEKESGEFIRMNSLKIGDRVRVGATEFSTIFMFTHKDSSSINEFVRLKLASGVSVEATSGHYMPVNGGLTSAGSVTIGDVMTVANGARSPVVDISRVFRSGLFNPQTLEGNIVVDGILASTYTQAVDAQVAHALLSPLRFLYRLGALPSFATFEYGSGIIAKVAPQGPSSIY